MKKAKKKRKTDIQWRPVTGKEALQFLEKWCCKCKAENTCMTVPTMFNINVRDEDMPKELIMRGNYPFCKKFAEKLAK